VQRARQGGAMTEVERMQAMARREEEALAEVQAAGFPLNQLLVRGRNLLCLWTAELT